MAATFLRRFGVEAPGSTNGYVIPAEWQSALSNGSSAGGILGLLVGLLTSSYRQLLTLSSTDGRLTDLDRDSS